ncbi:hypothetical protein ACWENA_35625 [Streptomyces sp. NPDC004779]
MGDANTPGADGRPSGSGEPPSGPPPGPLSGPSPRPPRRRAWLLAVVGVLVLAVGVSGLLAGTGAFGDGDGERTAPPAAPVSAAGDTGAPVNRPPTTAEATAPTSAPATAPTSASPSEASGEGLVPFGRSHRYEGGVEVTVSAPKRFTPAPSSAGHAAGNIAVAVEVTVRNDSGERLELSTVIVRGRDADGRETGGVFDADAGILPLSGGLLPGRKAVAVYGFDVPRAAATLLEVEVGVGFGGDSAFWFGKLG